MKKFISITEQDEGKRVVDTTGETVGVVAEVRDGTAYVDPDASLTDKLAAKLGWGDRDEDTYPVTTADIDTVTDDEIRLNRMERR